ncbi:alpha/beta hydrolase [Cytobacillus citreus]|uniref:alpha/beta hydrolase n=1 Tax=Cytobacillus citreus TaxID=2833586 RepID=UPI002017A557|nr:alpha/beta hydrolase [Cytobacillus citreus]
MKYLQEKGIPPLLKDIHTVEQWEVKRKTILDRWLEAIGPIPACDSVNVIFLSIDDEIDHFRIHLKYETVYEDWVTANLLIPNDGNGHLTLSNLEDALFSFKGASKKKPAILALHPTSPEGKDDVTLTSGRVNRTYGLELVKRGYIVLAPDTITAGERVQSSEESYHTASFYERNPNWSAVAKMLVDHRQGVSVLSKITSVNNIGAIGHSLGGYNAYFLAGIDKRVKAVVCSCGFAVFANDPERERWGRRSWFSHIPKVSDYLLNNEVPFEFNEIAALVAPTPFFIWIGQKDKIFPHWEQMAAAVNDIDHLYTFLEEEIHFKSLIGNAGHDFPSEIRTLAYNFLDEKLK